MVGARKQNSQKTVKAFENDIQLINERAKLLGCSAAEVIHQMCQGLRKQMYLRELAESFDGMRANAEQLAKFEAEQKVWDSVIADGLDNAT